MKLASLVTENDERDFSIAKEVPVEHYDYESRVVTERTVFRVFAKGNRKEPIALCESVGNATLIVSALNANLKVERIKVEMLKEEKEAMESGGVVDELFERE